MLKRLTVIGLCLLMCSVSLDAQRTRARRIRPRPPAVSTYPDATNTGWAPTGVTLTPYGGPSTITTNGTTIDSKEITTCLTIQANNVTIKRSWIHGCTGTYAIDNYASGSGGTGLLLEDLTLDCPTTEAGHTGVADSNYTARRVKVNGCENGLWAENDGLPSGTVLIEDSYIERVLSDAAPGGPHPDGIQIPSNGHDITIQHNTIINTANGTTSNPSNSAVTMGGAIVNLTLTNNLMAGGGYTLYCNQTAFGGGPTNVVYTNNHFSTRFALTVGSNGPTADCSDESSAFTGNKCHEANTSLSASDGSCPSAPEPVPLWELLSGTGLRLDSPPQPFRLAERMSYDQTVRSRRTTRADVARSRRSHWAVVDAHRQGAD